MPDKVTESKLFVFNSSRVTQIVGIDCEFDTGHNGQLPCKVTIVNERGEIIIDTLIDDEGQRKYSLKRLHHIEESSLIGAPKLQEVL